MTLLRMRFGLWIGAVALAGAAEGQTGVCADRASVVDRLAAEYGETESGDGQRAAHREGEAEVGQ